MQRAQHLPICPSAQFTSHRSLHLPSLLSFVPCPAPIIIEHLSYPPAATIFVPLAFFNPNYLLLRLLIRQDTIGEPIDHISIPLILFISFLLVA
jgi:hypothetical protein